MTIYKFCIKYNSCTCDVHMHVSACIATKWNVPKL